MTETQVVRKMQKLELMMAGELDRICKKHGFTYFMTGGTLLGAIRHKGFIPWDDDMDFGMLRPDFDRFCEIAQQELDPEKYFFQTMQTDPGYTYCFAKIRLKNTHVTESFAKDAKAMDGLYIDIFPYDMTSDNKLQRSIQYKSFYLLRNILWVKLGYGEPERKAQRSTKITYALSHLFSARWLKAMKMKTIRVCKGHDTESVICTDGSNPMDFETIPHAWFKDIVEYPFEDRTFPSIRAYEPYLRHLYKDYMQLPPVEKRNHHERLAVDFGPYAGNDEVTE